MSAKLSQLPSWPVQIMVGVIIAISAFLISNEVSSLQTHDTALEQRVALLETRNANQDAELSALHIQMDTINQRGTTGADARLNDVQNRMTSLEARVSSNSDRLARLEQIIFRNTNGGT